MAPRGDGVTRARRKAVKASIWRLPVVKELREQLAEARRRLLRAVEATAPNRGWTRKPPGRRTRAAETSGRGRRNDHERRRLREIAAAEARLDAGVFGLCEV
jgi:RNA polymerase-binding transcription factor DksA